MQKEKIENSDLISILMPTYNVEKFVEEAVRSILYQTYKNFELIIVDDCSTDKTFEILERLAEEDDRIRLYRNDVNSKICKTLNKAYSYAKGAYIGRMDGDDVSEPERFELLKQYLEENANIDLVGSNLISIDENGVEFSRKRYPRLPRTIQWGNRFISSVSHIWLARYEVYETLAGYREVPFVEDYDFLLRGELKGFMYANIDAYVYRCRIRTGNTGSTNGLRQRKAVEYIQALHAKEKRLGCDCFCYEDYCEAIKVSEEENKQYINAAKKLNDAIQSKKQPIRLIVTTMSAMFKNRYVAKYIINAARFRCLIAIEKVMKDG